MSSLEFVLSLIVVLITFLAFALTMTTILLGNNKTKRAAIELFKGLLKGLRTAPQSLRTRKTRQKSYPVKVKQNGEVKV